jgi:hypothetical protein
MKPLQIALFVILNVIFITQSGRDIHQLIWGAEASILDQFEPETTKARSEKNIESLVDEYRKVFEHTHALEDGKRSKEVADIRQKQTELYATKAALHAEITERETKKKEFRDLWIFTSFGAVLVVVGGILYRSRIVWPGLSVLVAGFVIFEYWASPAFFSGADDEFRALLVSKTLLTIVALVALYVLWRGRETETVPAICGRVTP